jgi:hypothetical protein
MRRLLITIISAASLMFSAAAAQAHGPAGAGGAGGAGGPVSRGRDATPQTVVVGTIQSVDSSAGTFVANAYIVNHGHGDGHGHGGFDGDVSGHQQQPATTQVTISTDSNTNFDVDGHSGTIDNLAQGQKFDAVFSGSPNGDEQTFLNGNPAVSVFARTPHARKQLYAFVGSVTGVDTANGTVSVDITRTLPSDLAAAGSTATFTIGSDTLVLGGSGNGLFGGSLSNVSVGDIVAGGVTAPSGDTTAQIEALPLRILLDLPATSSAMASKASRAHARTHALDKALSLLGEKKSKSHKSKKSRKHHAHTKSDRARTHAKHA